MRMGQKLNHFFQQLGPGFLIAATGVGAGDMVAATVGGAQYGTVILWASVTGALLKYVLNEGVARWQLATDRTLLQGWISHFHRGVSWYFVVYLVVWSVVVAGALMASCGLAAHAVFPELSVQTWGIIHTMAALILVLLGRYQLLEVLMKLFIGLMFITVLANLMLMTIDWGEVLTGLLVPHVPDGGGPLILGIIGGVGGSVTLLSYGYWLREKGWAGSRMMGRTRIDLAMAYLLTGLFGVSVIILSAEVSPDLVKGNRIVLTLAEQLQLSTGIWGKWVFIIGFWGAVFSSMLGVWSGVPYLFADFVQNIRQPRAEHSPARSVSRSWAYRGFLFFMAVPPALLLYLQKPVWIIILYAVAGAFFMPFLALMLLLMNNTVRWVAGLKNGWLINLLLGLTFILFGYLLVMELISL